MRKFEYQETGKKNQKQLWVCEACKKKNNGKILLGEWKLIDMGEDNDIPCDVCSDEEALGKEVI